ncbi:polysaccharide deacetylase family protein [Faecalicatena contorta]|uniref:polysaccharide deacetylase family protein n=1 Tax=Faecalicatena contorta TaxID=39482 RepID=UPI001F1E9558|nr:polysaccharide deacetylase family protein [Faecalicatena contorta]MCF2683901.1 polysaccharide deacetylase family protein [Faecalicatena contorta]
MRKKEETRWKNYGILVLMLMIAMVGSYKYISSCVSISNNVNGRELPVYSVETDEKKVALTFDAAWGNEDTQAILDILKKHNVHVTFFMTGGWVENNPQDVKAIWQAGHDLGNHSENHKNMSQLSVEEQTQEIMRTHEKVKALTGVEMQLFRPPYGDYDDHVILTAQECGYYPIQWSVDVGDTNEKKSYKRFQEKGLFATIPSLGILICYGFISLMRESLFNENIAILKKGSLLWSLVDTRLV